MIELKLFLLLLNERVFFPIADNSRVRTILLFSASQNQRVFSFLTVSALFVKTVQRRVEWVGAYRKIFKYMLEKL